MENRSVTTFTWNHDEWNVWIFLLTYNNVPFDKLTTYLTDREYLTAHVPLNVLSTESNIQQCSLIKIFMVQLMTFNTLVLNISRVGYSVILNFVAVYSPQLQTTLTNIHPTSWSHQQNCFNVKEEVGERKEQFPHFVQASRSHESHQLTHRSQSWFSNTPFPCECL